MLTQLNPKERLGYFALILAFLGVFGYIGASQFKRPAEVKLEPLEPAPSIPRDVPSAEVVVHVVGAVKNPGMVRLTPSDRVEDAIRDRGGSLPSADLEAINLAAKLADGTQLLVPTKGKPEPEKIAEQYRGGGSEIYAAKPAAASASSSSSRSKDPAPKSVSINSAGQAQLETLPGIGPATAKKILEYRQAHGGFSSIDELMAVKGIGPKKLEAMKPFVRL